METRRKLGTSIWTEGWFPRSTFDDWDGGGQGKWKKCFTPKMSDRWLRWRESGSVTYENFRINFLKTWNSPSCRCDFCDNQTVIQRICHLLPLPLYHLLPLLLPFYLFVPFYLFIVLFILPYMITSYHPWEFYLCPFLAIHFFYSLLVCVLFLDDNSLWC